MDLMDKLRILTDSAQYIGNLNGCQEKAQNKRFQKRRQTRSYSGSFRGN